MTKPFVAVLMGSDSDLPVVQTGIDILKQFDIPVEVRITSAHRTPQATHDYVREAEAKGCAVYICCAGMAAHLAGVVAGLSLKPVIGVPIEAGSLRGIDALLSTVQMPAGIPVASMAIGKAGAKNAAYLAAQILSLGDAGLAEKLKLERAEQGKKVLDKNKNI